MSSVRIERKRDTWLMDGADATELTFSPRSEIIAAAIARHEPNLKESKASSETVRRTFKFAEHLPIQTDTEPKVYGF
jgi:hypothetical protein